MRSRVGSAVAVLLLGCAAGCSSEDSSGTDPGPTGEPSPTAASSGPSPTPSSSTAAAEGEDVDTPALSYQLPGRGWRLGRGGYSASADTADSYWTLGIGVHQSFAGDDTDAFAETSLSVAPAMDPPAERLDDRTVDGVEGYVLESSGPDGLFYEFGAVVDDQRVYLDFEASRDAPAAREWIDHVLASVVWK